MEIMAIFVNANSENSEINFSARSPIIHKFILNAFQEYYF